MGGAYSHYLLFFRTTWYEGNVAIGALAMMHCWLSVKKSAQKECCGCNGTFIARQLVLGLGFIQGLVLVLNHHEIPFKLLFRYCLRV